MKAMGEKPSKAGPAINRMTEEERRTWVRLIASIALDHALRELEGETEDSAPERAEAAPVR